MQQPHPSSSSVIAIDGPTTAQPGGGGAAPLKEFVLRTADSNDKFHVARFNVPVDMNSWHRPLRAYRQDVEAEIKEEAAAAAEAAPPRWAGRRTRIRGTSLKNMPLIFEDTAKEHSFEGRISKGGDTSTHFLFVVEVT